MNILLRLRTTVISFIFTHLLNPVNVINHLLFLVLLYLVRNVSIVIEYALFSLLLNQVRLTHYLMVQIIRSHRLLVRIPRH